MKSGIQMATGSPSAQPWKGFVFTKGDSVWMRNILQTVR